MPIPQSRAKVAAPLRPPACESVRVLPSDFPPHPRAPTLSGLEAILSNIRIGFFGAAMLVLLRITIGWHIMYEGIWKYQQQDFSADGYLGMATGPFADYFHDKVMVDFEGRNRLSEQWNVDEMNRRYDRFVAEHKLDDAAKARAEQVREKHKAAVVKYLKDPANAEKIATNLQGWDRLNKQKEEVEAKHGGAPYESQRVWDGEQKLRNEAKPWLKWVDDEYDAYHEDLRQVLPAEARDTGLMAKIKEGLTDTNQFVTYANIAIGFCLIVGLFSRAAALGGGVFLLMIVAAKLQWPGYYMPPAHPAQGHTMYVTKEFVEMMACFALAMLPTGRWGGIDYFLHGIFVRPFLRNKD
jgi:uncharacterized membrane protein YphA (DoxX/SURF4 family)